MAAPILVVEKLRKVYTRGFLMRRPTFMLEADFTIESPRIVAVIGPNGAGKTTLFEIVTGSNTPTHGRVLVAGTDIHRVKYRQRDRLAIHYETAAGSGIAVVDLASGRTLSRVQLRPGVPQP